VLEGGSKVDQEMQLSRRWDA